MIRRDDILRGHDKDNPLSQQLESNLSKLLLKINAFIVRYGKPVTITSGYRPSEFNKSVGGGKNSAHLYCLAVDLHDPDDEIKKFCMETNILDELNLFMECPSQSDKWCHLQIRHASRRIFSPRIGHSCDLCSE